MIKNTLCLSNPAYLSLEKSQLVIRLPEVEKSNLPAFVKQDSVITRPIEDLAVVILAHPQITITQCAVEALLAQNCALITCDCRGMPNGLMLPLSGNSVQSERFQQQLEASLPLKKQLWQQTMQAKIHNQAEVLHRFTDEEVRCMHVWAESVRSGDPDNLEGRAAAHYWRHLFPQIENFTRDREGAAPNHWLNYGYAILRAVVARALVGSGLLPTLGIHHHNRYNAYCLADDIMEPYRPYVDAVICQMLQEYGTVSELQKEHKVKLLGIPTLEVVIAGKRSPLMVAVSQTTSSLYKCYSGEARKVLYPEM
jgi:CRISPR-associated protein Cas1